MASVFFLSLGCDKNLSDSEHMLKLLSDAGFSFTDREEEADAAVINTCAFIGDAKKESIDEIFRLSSYKKTGRLRALVVAGCLAERYQKELLSEIPEIDGAVGTSSWDRLPEVLAEALAGKRPSVFDEKERTPAGNGRIITTGGHYGYLKIAEGCNKHCAYCVIPKIRGRYRSFPIEALLSEASGMVSGGVTELILVAQETTVYGVDLYGRKALPELLRRLSEIPDLHWIRLLYCYPEELTDELIETIRTNPKVLPYLDLPIQHSSDRILKAMRRSTTKKGLIRIIEKLRKKIPGIALRTTLITGFPGETEEDFQDLLEFVRTVRFDRLGVFPYSREENTEAYSMHPAVPLHVRKRRRNEIMRVQQQISKERSASCVGQCLEVFVEGRLMNEDRVYTGRTYRDAPDVDGLVFFTSDCELESGRFVQVRITGSKEYDLIGELCS
ncbi:MAG: 30S ribosomal protein S12 methylthiotransferase RimO [Lachnospiraceae bacterium]|nr:30S ribosomal protein S12 methylthiotransferase RimO [Lachnospiraceae bacterium]